MQLTKFTDYGLRLLIHAKTAAPARVSTGSVAKRFGVSDHHLSKVAACLVKAGYLTSERGRNGGVALAKSADDIRLGDVVRTLSQTTSLVECMGAAGDMGCDCVLLPACGLRGPLAEAQNAFYTALNTHTLADVTKNKRVLEQLLIN